MFICGELEGRVYAAVPFAGYYNCSECGVGAGKFHHPRCNEEICPVCNDYLMECDCGLQGIGPVERFEVLEEPE